MDSVYEVTISLHMTQIEIFVLLSKNLASAKLALFAEPMHATWKVCFLHCLRALSDTHFTHVTATEEGILINIAIWFRIESMGIDSIAIYFETDTATVSVMAPKFQKCEIVTCDNKVCLSLRSAWPVSLEIGCTQTGCVISARSSGVKPQFYAN